MALKQFYATEAEVPTEQKAFYVLKDGKYELQVEGFESVTGVLAKNTELITKQKTDKAEIDRLTSETARMNGEIGKLAGDLSAAQSKAVPNGYVTVPKKEAELITRLKEKNLDPETVGKTLEEVETIRKENEGFKLEKSIGEFARAVEVQNVGALTRLIKQDGLTPKVVEVEEDGKKVKKGILVAKDGETETDHPYADYKTKHWGDFANALDAKSDTKAGFNGGPTPTGPPSDIEAEKAAQARQSASTLNIF